MRPRTGTKKVNEVHEVGAEDAGEDAGDQESMLSAEGDPDDLEEGTDDGGDEPELEGDGDQGPDAAVYEAFLAGWKAKNKTPRHVRSEVS